ncbi:MAG: c-type cytochrome [Burkholderiales bacterium]|nr:c-type cytochrome [Burkholderiales bacterium]
MRGALNQALRWSLLGWALAASALVPAHAAGDALRGAQAYEVRCTGCHSVETDRVGPRHAGVFGRRAGSVAGFDYSPALKSSGVVWDSASLERWLTDPEKLVPGQRMGFSVADPAVRADVVAYLATLTAKK